MPNRKFLSRFLPQKYAGLGIQLIPSVIFGFLPKNQPFLQKLADFSKFCLNAVGKTVLFDLEPQYITFIQKKKFESKKSIFGYFWLIFGWIWLIFMTFRVSLWRRDKNFGTWFWAQYCISLFHWVIKTQKHPGSQVFSHQKTLIRAN